MLQWLEEAYFPQWLENANVDDNVWSSGSERFDSVRSPRKGADGEGFSAAEISNGGTIEVHDKAGLEARDQDRNPADLGGGHGDERSVHIQEIGDIS